MDDSYLITRDEAAKALRISVRGIDRLRRQGELIGMLIGARRLFSWAEITDFINRRLKRAEEEQQ